MTIIAQEAEEKVGLGNVDQGGAMSQVNIWNDVSAGRNLAKAQEDQRQAAYQLKTEPMIARVRTRSENGADKVYYFTRNFTLTVPGINLTSYNSGAPVGRLASLDVGDDFELPNGQWVEVVEKGTFRPLKSGAQWDGVDNSIDMESVHTFYVESLRRVMEQRGRLDEVDPADPFAVFDDQPVIVQTKKRSFLSGLGLRDQSVMNKVQDEIFRLPINRQVMLEGPPGTGKTTTLIKRLSQKRIENPDREEDYRVIANNPLGGEHQNSWIMFSPTELLEHYLREAFARDNVPASQQRIQTWSSFRNDLALRALGLLRSGKGGQGFLRDDTAEHLSDYALQNQPELHAAFSEIEFDLYRAELDRALQTLIDSEAPDLRDIAISLRRRVNDGGRLSLLPIHLAVDSVAPELRKWGMETRRDITTSVDRRIDQIGRIRGKDGIEELRRLVSRIDSDVTEEDDDEMIEADAVPVTTRERMFRVLRG